jgi:hypothetical protein
MRNQYSGQWRRIRARGFLLAIVFSAVLSVLPSPASAIPAEPAGDRYGTTPGWRDGSEITLYFSIPAFCRQPPESRADSGCEVGAEAQVLPPTEDIIPEVVFLTPVGFSPDRDTLSCERRGHCPGHPRTIDLSRRFGPGSQNVFTPPHSIVFDAEADDRSVYWSVHFVFVYELDLWEELAAERNLEAVEEAQEAGEPISENVPTNLFIYFFAPE